MTFNASCDIRFFKHFTKFVISCLFHLLLPFCKCTYCIPGRLFIYFISALKVRQDCIEYKSIIYFSFDIISNQDTQHSSFSFIFTTFRHKILHITAFIPKQTSEWTNCLVCSELFYETYSQYCLSRKSIAWSRR